MHPVRSTPPSRARRSAALVGTAMIAAAVCAIPTTAFAVTTVTTANTAAWQIHDASRPGLDTGSLRAVSQSGVDGFGHLMVQVAATPEPRGNGEMLRGFGLTFDGTSEYDSTAAVALGGVEVTRQITMDAASDSARYLDTLINTTDAPITVDVSFGGALGYGSGATQSLVRSTSSGDAVVGTEDAWTLSAATQANRRAIGVVVGSPAPFAGAMTGTGNPERNPFETAMATTGHEANFNAYLNTLELAPGETRSLLRYVVAGPNNADSQTVATATLTGLAAAPDLEGLSSAEVCSIANWDLGAIASGLVCDDTLTIDTPDAPEAANPLTSSPYDVVNKTIAQLQADMTSGATTSEQIVQAYLDRIRVYDLGQMGYNSFIHVSEDALANARAADAARAEGATGELLGIPIAIKDLYDTVDMPTTGGTAALDGYQPDHDARQVELLRAAGAVIIGKTNLSEFANSGSYSESGFGQVWNALYPSKTSFGSSGGSAVAVSASLAAGSLGSQTGVSLYAPTTGSSLTTFRGTDGMASLSGVMPLTWGQDYGGPIARTVTDLAYILNATTGTDPDDILTVDADAHRPEDWTAGLSVEALDSVRVGYIPSSFTSSFADDGTGQAVMDRFSVLEEAGATMVELTSPPSGPRSPGGSRNIEGWARYIEEQNGLFPFADGNALLADTDVLPYNQRSLGTTPRMTQEQVDAWLQYRADYKQIIGDWMEGSGVDVIVYAGFLSDMYNNDGNSSQHSSDRGTGVLTSNVGLPTVVVPVGTNPHGYSISMQLVGPAWSDAEVLGMGYALEQIAQGQQLVTGAPALAYDGSQEPEVPEQPEPGAPGTGDPEESEPVVTLSASTIGVGEELTVHASGFPSGEAVEIWLESDPVLLGSTIADEDGAFTLTVTIPSDTAPGEHHIVVRAGDVTASAALTVTAELTALPATGYDAGSSGLLAGGLLAAGALVLFLARRRGSLTR